MITEKKPLVSIFIPYYNDEMFLKDSIGSILNQTYKNFELILLNHACLDNSRQIAHSYDDIRIKHIDMTENLGAGSGILFIEFLKLAKGKYLKLFCADDVMLPTCIYDLVNFMENNPQTDFAFGDVEYVDEKLESRGTSFFKDREHFSVNNDETDCIKLLLTGTSFLPYIGNIIRKNIFEKTNININKTYIMMFDMSLWAEFLVNGYKIGYLNKIVALYRYHKSSFSYMKKLGFAIGCSIYEHIIWPEIFLKIKNINIIKKLFDKSKYIDKLDNPNDIPFIIMEHFFRNNAWDAPFAYKYLNDLLSDDAKRMHLQNKFGFGIKEFRKIYTAPEYKSLRQLFIYDIKSKKLNFFELLIACMRYAMSFKRITNFVFHKIKKKKLSI